MKKKIVTVPAFIFLFILSIFFYLLIIERDASELPSNLLNKNVPEFKTESLIKKDLKPLFQRQERKERINNASLLKINYIREPK